ncbi:PREDICTED: death-inducer obliterator 1 [Ceratosolen solmsi marchali]|uniref:Death-inducer obliterator 1 n=1 Tax=Ceratosolen solmsi marchali TaxID=326594 RepID=A0AAJ6YTA8_9HYME|nr:PREDICTED: death-inducer obliterator 1 [Ceratosolen solmsi marchali]
MHDRNSVLVMSSSYVVDPEEGKKDNTLILMVNDNGVISVDQDTLQSLILNQSNATVSVVRLGQTENDAAEGNITLTVDPPSFIPSETNTINNATDSTPLVDPFMEMDAEQLERLETALQSEEAKQILGENVTAMLDMLTVEEQQHSIRYNIELDHCYTSRFSPSESKLTASLPDFTTFDIDESMCIDLNKSGSHTPMLLPISSTNVNNSSMTSLKQKLTSTLPKIVKQPVSMGSRLRRASTALHTITSTPKLTVNARVASNLIQENKLHVKIDNEVEDELLLSSESSESEESDSDSDFGPKSYRKGVRARGGRRGLTTRGGSMVASRRRGYNKQMDSEQVRRLDLEMAAAVSAMKSPEKNEKADKQSPGKSKKKSFGCKKKDELDTPVSLINEILPIEQNILQTTNQVKANLINTNMLKGDMILTKPGQSQNQKVIFVQKQLTMNSNDIKPINNKKQLTAQKNKTITSQNSKLNNNKDITMPSSTLLKEASILQQSTGIQQNMIPVEMQIESVQGSIQIQKIGSPTILKMKSTETKKEKKKAETTLETLIKPVVDSSKSVEIKTFIAQRKTVKKEQRKSDTFIVEALGPALFSTPDIIRRVGSAGETKVTENPIISSAAISSSIISNTSVSTPVMSTATNISTISNSNLSTTISVINMLNDSTDTNVYNNNPINEAISTKYNANTLILTDSLVKDKVTSKVAIAEIIQPVANSTFKSNSSKEIPLLMEQSNNLKPIASENIEGDDHLLATLEIEADKQLPNDEELLAEALLLQETLGVELDPNGLTDQTIEMPESILSSSIMTSTSTMIGSSKKRESISTVSHITSQEPEAEVEPVNKKDTKDPIQIVRGGRVITLPPIEAPATRSKRLQAKTENEKIKNETKQHQSKVQPFIIKTERTSRTTSHISLQKQDMIYDIEDDEEEEEVNSDSEDDPNRLWCICRQPHNNRFMICCDICQDWFHGKCVHVTKAMGEQMENQGIEWVCPNCLKKKNEESKFTSMSKKQKSNIVDAMSNECNRTLPTSLNSRTSDLKVTTNCGKSAHTSLGITHCVVCKKEARKSSIYCSDACILAHAEVTSTKEKPSLMQTRTSKSDMSVPKLKSDIRIVVFDKKTGKVLTGTDAPSALNLKVWLKEHPTYEVVKSNSLNAIDFEEKTAAITQGNKTNKLIQGKSIQSKMIYSKVIGSKQTILASSAKKTVLLTDIPSRQTSITSPQSRVKQITSKTGRNSTPYLKQINIQSSLQQQQQQQQSSQRSVSASIPKPTFKKLQDAKASISQLKQQQQKQQQHATVNVTLLKKPETEPIRLNVRKILAELLSTRIKETNDLSLNTDEIIELALQIELEMYKFFKETGAKYKAKYRSLVFNIKDTKNLTLFRKIANRSLSPNAVVKLSPEEMASQELAEWREKENKHQLEMIKKNELDLMTQAKSIVVKTHKGELLIENDGIMERVDPKTPVQDIVTALNCGETISSTVEESIKDKEKRLIDDLKKIKMLEEEKKKREKERDKEKRHGRSRDREKRHNRSISKNSYKDRDKSKEKKLKDGKYKDHARDKDKERDKSREREKKDKNKEKKDKHKQARNSLKSHNKSRYKELKEKHKKEEELRKETGNNDMSTVNMDKAIEERLWRHIEDETTTNTLDGNDSDVSDREPSSTVTIKTPDINDLDKDIFEPNPKKETQTSTTVWRGFVYMADVAKFFVTAQNVSGNSKDLMEDLPDTFDVVGRINPITVWDYIGKMKKNATKEILIIKLTATNDEEKIPYITLYSYLNSRNRLGVLGNISPNIKDFYIMPFSNGSKLPSVLLPLDTSDLEEHRHHLLLGIIVVQRKKRSVSNSIPLCPVPSKLLKKELSDRCYTPPAAQTQLLLNNEGMTPPNSPKPTTQIRASTHIKQNLSVISKIVPELSSKISLEFSKSSDKMQVEDEDEPYSPGEPVDVVIDDKDVLLTSSNLKQIQPISEVTTVTSPIKSSTELQRKMEELSRQIEEEKQQIQNISSSFLNDTSTTLPGLGLDPPDNGNTIEAYSPLDTRSFTPPPQGISKFAQPILDKVSNITIPPNLQEILANVKRQENSKLDSYLPSKPSATFLTTVNSTTYLNSEKYSPTYNKTSSVNRLSLEMQSTRKEIKSTLSSLSDYDIMKKAEEELAALAASSVVSVPSIPTILPPVISSICSELHAPGTSFEIHR